MTYYDKNITIDDVNIGDVGYTYWDMFIDGNVNRYAIVVDKGIDESYAGGGWLRLDIDGKRTVRLSVQWFLPE